NVPVSVGNHAASALSVLALVVLLRYAQGLFILMMLAVLTAYALNPLVTVLERCRIHRTVAAVAVVFALFGGIGSAGYALRQQATTVLDSVPAAIAKVRNQIQKYRSASQSSTPIEKIQQAANEIEKTAAEATNTQPSPGVTKVQN